MYFDNHQTRRKAWHDIILGKLVLKKTPHDFRKIEFPYFEKDLVSIALMNVDHANILKETLVSLLPPSVVSLTPHPLIM